MGPRGADGADGQDGRDGQDGVDAPIPPGAYSVFTGSEVSNRNGISPIHGVAAMQDEAQLEGAPANPKWFATLAVTSVSADPGGVVTVSFTISPTPVTTLTTASAGVFKLAPAGGGRSYNRWVPYIFRPGRAVNAGYRENNTSSTPLGTLVANSRSSYTYRFGTNLATARYLWDPTGASTASPGPLVGYDRSLTHRVSIYIGGHAGPTGEVDLDFVPAGGAVTQTRDIVRTAACQKCHGWEFSGHGGDRVTVEGCNACHSPDSAMVNSAANFGKTESIEMQVMIHKIHAGRELQSAPGADGIFFDDPLTAADESADNGTYTVGSKSASWRAAAFPAGIANCTVCHTGAGSQVNNWKTVPSRAACGSCHDLVDWTVAHQGGVQSDDSACAGCHQPAAIVGYHAFMTKDVRNDPEFLVSVWTSAPTNGSFFGAGESPKITIQLRSKPGGALIDHTTVVEDPSGEGCTPNATLTACTNPADGLFRNANLYVTGPRAKRVPVLTTAARARVTSATAGPWDLRTGGSLRVIVDGGNFIVYPDHDGEDVLVPGDMTVTLPAFGAAFDALFASSAAVTAQELVGWLNGPTATVVYNERTFTFSDRAIAYVEGGRVSIRSRAKGSFNPSVQVPELTRSLGLFTDTAVKVAGSAAQVRQRTNPANDDPKAAFFTDRIEYSLDPVDDLVPGTYMINVEFADRGRPSNTANYRTPSIAVTTFQVKQATVEKPIAGNCTSCHWSTDAVGQGQGYVLDPVRHNKPFDAQAVDQCGGCHGYKSGETQAARTWTTGGGTKPISKRVHAVHNGAALNYPVLTVDHEESVAGRGWRITYPQSVRNCESCHPDTATSGTWKTVPNRLACMGCHDSDAGTAHMRIQVYDPTPTAPWSGDEVESCATCH